MPTPLYSQYLESFRRVKRAADDGAPDLLHALEVEPRELGTIAERIAGLAIHDAAKHLPVRGEPHFWRLLASWKEGQDLALELREPLHLAK